MYKNSFSLKNTDECEDYLEEKKIINHFLRIIDRTCRKFKRDNQKWYNLCILTNEYYNSEGDRYEIINDLIGEEDIDYSEFSFEDQIEMEALGKALRNLTAYELEFVYMKYYEDLDRITIAKRLGVSNLRSISNLQKRVLNKIRKNMMEVYCYEK